MNLPIDPFRQALRGACRVLPNNPVIPIYACVKIAQAGESGTVLATDGDGVWVRTDFKAPGGYAEATWVVSGTSLLRWLENASSEAVAIREAKSVLSLEAGNARARFATTPPEKYPELEPQSESQATIVLAAEHLKACLEKTILATEKRETVAQFHTAGVQFDISDGQFTLVATDSRRLSVANVTGHNGSQWVITGQDAAEMVPASSLKILLPLLGEGDVTVVLSKHHALFRGDGYELGSKLLARKLPPWRKFVEWCKPAEGKEIPLPVAVLETAVRQATAGLDGDLRLELLFKPDHDCLHLSVPGRTDVRLDLGGRPPGAAVAFDPDYLLDFLQVCRRQRIETVTAHPPAEAKGLWSVKAGDSWAYYLAPMVEPKEAPQ